jgi:outer membrane lipoprotein-sorting protein
MSDLPHPCEDWAEPISLAAAGCLSSDEEQEVRRHVETCPDCREQFRQLTDLCRALAEAPLATDSTEAAIVERIMSAVTADVSRRPIVRTREEMIHPTLFSRSLDTWRWIMRSSVSRISAAAILALAIGGIAVWFHGGGTTPAFADFIEPILSAKTVTFKTTFEDEGQKITGKVMAMASPQRTRSEQDMPSKQKMVTIVDDTGHSLVLRPAEKVAIVTTSTNVPKEKRPKAIFFELRSQLADARDQPDWIREPLGEKVIDGRSLVGYRLTGHGMICDLWGDPKTGMPVRIENSAPSNPNMKPMICSDFVFDADLDESLFSLEPPAGYKVQKLTVDVSPAKEKDLIETLRRYAQLRGGALPDQLDVVAFTKLFQEDWAKSNPMKDGSPSEEERQEQLNGLLKFGRGFSFAFEQLPREADAHYAGKGVKVGAADTPVFWYRPGDAKKYRIISADLSVREADTAPSVPNAQPVVSASGPKK